MSATSAPAEADTTAAVSAMTRACSTVTAPLARASRTPDGAASTEAARPTSRRAAETSSRRRWRSHTADEDAPCATKVPRPSNYRTTANCAAASRCSSRCVASSAAIRSCSESAQTAASTQVATALSARANSSITPKF